MPLILISFLSAAKVSKQHLFVKVLLSGSYSDLFSVLGVKNRASVPKKCENTFRLHKNFQNFFLKSSLQSFHAFKYGLSGYNLLKISISHPSFLSYKNKTFEVLYQLNLKTYQTV